MTKSHEKSAVIPARLNKRAPEDAAGGYAAEPRHRPDAREPDVLAEVRHELDQIVVELGERGIGGTWNIEAEFRAHTTDELDAKVTKCTSSLTGRLKKWSGSPGADPIDVLMYVWQASWELWDRSLVYRTLQVVVDATAGFVGPLPSPGAGEPRQSWEDKALFVVAHAMGLLQADADVYREMNLSSPGRLADAARGSAGMAGEVLDEVRSVLAMATGRPGDSEDREKTIENLAEIADTADQVKILYNVILYAAAALTCFEKWLAVAPRLGSADPEPAETGQSDPDVLQEDLRKSVNTALSELHTAQKSLQKPILGECEPWEQLLIEILDIANRPYNSDTAKVFAPKRASIRYCYPFAMQSDQEFTLEKSGHVKKELQAALDSNLERVAAGKFGRAVAVKELKRLEPTEFFAAQDSSTRLYDGVRIKLSDIELGYNTSSGSSEKGAPEKCNVWIDLSRMGNHCLCVEPVGELEVALPHLLYRSLRAGTPFVVGAEVSIIDSSIKSEAAWDSMHLFSRDIIYAISKAEFWKTGGKGPAAPPVRGNLHEVVVLRTDGPLATEMDDVAVKLDRSVGGRMLTRSIQRAATSFEEWVRYPPAPRSDRGDRVPAIAPVTEIGLAGDWFTHTGETTIFGIAAAPPWHSDVYMEAGQFASSWSPLLRLWSRRLQEAIEISQSAVENADSLPLEKTGDVREGNELRSIEGKLRSHLSQIWSEELCATLAHRRFLDQLLGAAGLDRLQRELEAQLGSAERMTDYWNEQARQKRDEEYRSNEEQRKEADSRREALLAVIALFGLFELGTFLTVADVTNLFSTTRHHGIWEDWLMLGVFIVGCSLVALFIFRGRRGKLKDAKQNRRSRGDVA